MTDEDKDLKEEEGEEGGGTLSESALEAFDEDAGPDSLDELADKEFKADDEEEDDAFFDVPPEDRW